MNNFNLAFEEFMAWHIDTGTFYISGRDIIGMIIGFLICLMLWAVFDGKEIKFGKSRSKCSNSKDGGVPQDTDSKVQDGM